MDSKVTAKAYHIVHVFFIRNWFIKNSSQIGLLTHETYLASLIFLRNLKNILRVL